MTLTTSTTARQAVRALVASSGTPVTAGKEEDLKVILDYIELPARKIVTVGGIQVAALKQTLTVRQAPALWKAIEARLKEAIDDKHLLVDGALNKQTNSVWIGFPYSLGVSCHVEILCDWDIVLARFLQANLVRDKVTLKDALKTAAPGNK